MDARQRNEDPRATDDLAAIVLRSARNQPPAIAAPESVPSWIDRHVREGYDARSVAILALVVAVLAGLVGWVTRLDDPRRLDTTGQSAAKVSPDDDTPARAAESGTAPSAATSGESTTPAPAPVQGADLVPGRLVAMRSAAGSGLVRVSVRNAGATAAAAGAQVLVLMDGDVVGSETLAGVPAGAATTADIPVGWCPAGAVSLVAVVDASTAVREGDERNNSLSRSATFGC